MSTNKRAWVLSGLPGSGKSTWAKSRGRRCSADKHFEQPDGSYVFVPQEIGMAHASCLREFVQALQDPEVQAVICDNTNTSLTEIAPYCALALAFGAELEILVFECDVATAVARNTHGVPEAAIKAMAERLALLPAQLPPWWPVRVHGK